MTAPAASFQAHHLNFTCYVGMFVMGSLTGAVGPLVVAMTRFFELPLSRAALPVVFDTAGYFAGTLLTSFFWRLDLARLILSLSSLFLVVTLTGIVGLHQHFGLLLGLLFVLGLMSGFFSVGIDALFSEIYHRQRARFLILSHLFFGIGAFSGPLVVVAVMSLSDGAWHLFYLVMGLLSLPLVWNFPRIRDRRLRRSGSDTGRRERPRRIREPMGSMPFWFCMAIMFLVLGMEVTFISWTPLYLTEVRHIPETIASYCISIFWLALIFGRMVFYRFSTRIHLIGALTGGSLGTALFMGCVYVPQGRVVLMLFAAAAGLLYSALYPNVLAAGAGFYPRQVGFVTGAVSTSGAVGCIFFPWVMGPITEWMGLMNSVYMIPVMGLLMAAATVPLYFFNMTKGDVQ